MKKALSILMIAVLAFSIVACGDKNTPSTNGGGSSVTGSQSGVVDEDLGDIHIGVSLPITGSMAANGWGSKVAVEMAVEEVNAAGGINGRTLVLDIQDSKNESTDVSKIGTRFTEDEAIMAIIGEYSSTQCLVLAPICQEAELLMVSPTAALKEVAQTGKYVFSTWGDSAEENAFAAKVVKHHQKGESVAVMYVNDDWGIKAIENFTKKAEEIGLNIAIAEPFNAGNVDFSSIITKIKGATPTVDSVVWLGYYEEGANFWKQLDGAGGFEDVNKYLNNSCWTNTFRELLGDSLSFLEGANVASQVYFTESYPEGYEFAQKFSEATKGEQSARVTIANFYSTVHMMAEALRSIDGEITRDSVRDAFEAQSGFKMLSGVKNFDDEGNVARADFMMIEIGAAGEENLINDTAAELNAMK